jgi:S-DNA-T family DNA segregation ATPase FtsK/SpoIIIE
LILLKNIYPLKTPKHFDMARAPSIQLRKPLPALKFLPKSWQQTIQLFLHKLYALTVFTSGLVLFFCFLSYHPADPSLNTNHAIFDTASSVLHNWMGLWGAYIADLSLQSFGLGAFFVPLTLCAWGARFYRGDLFGPLWWRALNLIASLVLVSVFAALIPSFGWLAHTTMGGAFGVLLLNLFSSWMQPLFPWAPHLLVGFIALTLSFFALNTALALSRSERQAMIQGFVSGGHATMEHASSMWLQVMEWKKWGRGTAFEDENETIYLRKARKSKPTSLADEEDESDWDHDADDLERTFEDIKVIKPQQKNNKQQLKQKRSEQASLDLREPSEWELPSLDLLQETPAVVEDKLDETALRKNAELLQNVLEDYNVNGAISSIHPGPVVTLYELEPAPGTKTSRVVGLSDDIARSMSAVSVRAAVVPGRNVIGIELPNKKRQTVYLRELLEMKDFDKFGFKLPLVLGKDIGGHPIVADLAKMPHLLVAGTTGSGKSVAVNTMILSLLYKLPPEKCRFIMIDPKMLELSVYDDIPHLLSPVVTEPGRAIVALKWVVQEMENRYRNMSKLGVRNIEGYNQRLKEARKKGEVLMRKVQTGFDPDTGKPVYEEQPLDLTELPYIVVVVDEFADLMLVAGKDVEGAIQRLAQMARAAGIHLIMATQRPSVDVITGVIKANLPTRISFQVTSKIDSRTILGEAGAEQLLGKGDMLWMAGGRLTRVHGPFVSDEEVEAVAEHWRRQGAPDYLDAVTEEPADADGQLDLAGAGLTGGRGSDEEGDLYARAIEHVARAQKASTSFIQRQLRIGYNNAARLIERMEADGFVSAPDHVGRREVLVDEQGGRR